MARARRDGKARRGRSVALVLAGVMVAALTVSPAQAHIGNLKHLINKHLKPLFYTKKQANNRYFTKAQADARFAPIVHDHEGGGGGGDPSWALGGNAGTNPSTQFVGTTDNQPLSFRVNDARALRLEPAAIPNVIGGHAGNQVTGGVSGAAVGGGGGVDEFSNRVTDLFGTVGGGQGNLAGDDAGNVNDRTHATVSGGNVNTASGLMSTVAGGSTNAASGDRSTVSGGSNNTASHAWATVGGGREGRVEARFGTIAGGGPSVEANVATRNRVTGEYGTIGGGGNNQAGRDDGLDRPFATVAGGSTNTASAFWATVGGGISNTASAAASTVSGGFSNTSGGGQATVGGGWGNSASGANATVAGGIDNTASAGGATVPGGGNNIAAADLSFAAGFRAKANHDGAFVWADTTDADFASERANQFRVRANGGVRMDVNNSRWVDVRDDGTNVINTSTGARLTTGGAWTNASSRDLKEAHGAVDPVEILRAVAALPIGTWSYKAEDGSIRHLGPFAEDFYAAFGLGSDGRSISTVDADGVALAAIQGLYELLREKDARITLQNRKLAEQAERMTSLEKRLETLEDAIAGR